VLIVVSPAKSLDYESKLVTKKRSEPRIVSFFAKRARWLVFFSAGWCYNYIVVVRFVWGGFCCDCGCGAVSG